MLSNAYFLAKFRFATAENEPAKKLQILQGSSKIANFATTSSILGLPDPAEGSAAEAGPRAHGHREVRGEVRVARRAGGLHRRLAGRVGQR